MAGTLRDMVVNAAGNVADTIQNVYNAGKAGAARAREVLAAASADAPERVNSGPAPAPAPEPAPAPQPVANAAGPTPYDPATSPARAAAARVQPGVDPAPITPDVNDPLGKAKPHFKYAGPPSPGSTEYNSWNKGTVAPDPYPETAPRGPAKVTPSTSAYGDAFRAGGGSPEAQAWRASRAAAPAAEATATAVPAAAGGLRGMASKALGALGRVAEPILPAMGIYQGASDLGTGRTTEQARKDLGVGNTTGIFTGLRGLGVPENAARFADDLGVRFADASNRLVGGPLGLIGGSGTPPPVPASVAAGVRAATAQPPQPPVQTNQGPQTPEQVIAGNAVPEEGQGAFKRTTKGNVGPAQTIRSAEPRPAAPRPMTLDQLQGAQIGEMAKYGKEQSDKAYALKKQTADAATAKAGADIRDMNRKEVESRIKVNTAAHPDVAAIKDPKERAAAAEQLNNETLARYDYSLGRRNARRGDAGPAAVNDFMDAEKWRSAFIGSRGEMLQKFRDFVGDKQFNSNDSFSFRPAYRGKDGRIYSENGNNLGDTQSWRQSNWFSPNQIDSDMLRYVQGLPTEDEYKAKQKGAK